MACAKAGRREEAGLGRNHPLRTSVSETGGTLFPHLNPGIFTSLSPPSAEASAH